MHYRSTFDIQEVKPRQPCGFDGYHSEEQADEERETASLVSPVFGHILVIFGVDTVSIHDPAPGGHPTEEPLLWRPRIHLFTSTIAETTSLKQSVVGTPEG